MNDNFWVSIVVPSYNRQNTILDTMESIFSQTHRPIEVVVADDGSSDQTKEKVEDWACQYSDDTLFKVKYLSLAHGGGCSARNQGLDESKGDFVMFLDSDDLISSHLIEKHLKILLHADPGVATVSEWLHFKKEIDTIHVTKPKLIPSTNNQLSDWLSGWFVPPCGILWPKQELSKIGKWDESLTADQDGDFALRFLLQGGQFLKCLDSYAFYRIYSIPEFSVSKIKSESSYYSRFRVIEKTEIALTNDSRIDFYRDALSMRYARLAVLCAFDSPQVSKAALQGAKRVSINGKLPKIISYYWFIKLFGLKNKLLIARSLKKLFKLIDNSNHPDNSNILYQFNTLREMTNRQYF